MAIRLLIAHLTPEVCEIITEQGGEQKTCNYDVTQWTTPPGTTREQIGDGLFSQFLRVTLPDHKELLEVHIPVWGLSILVDAPDLLDEFGDVLIE